MAGRSSWGSIETLPSGRYRARYAIGQNRWRSARTTFTTKGEAEAWLSRERVNLELALAGSPKAVQRERPPRLRDYAATWIAGRKNSRGEPLRPSTRRTYEGYLKLHVKDTELGGMRLDEVRPADVKAWYATCDVGHPTGQARVYAMVKSMFTTAMADEIIDSNPCRIRGGSQAPTRRPVEVVTPGQVDALAAQLDEAGAVAVLLGCYGQLRIGEALALRRRDVDEKARGVDVSRQATRVGPDVVIGPPKTAAGVRFISLPKSVMERLVAYVKTLPPGRDQLLFEDPKRSGQPLGTQTITSRVRRAAGRAGLPEHFRYHHLRHSGLTLLAEHGATTGELQARAGHSTPAMAMRYQHARAVRDRALADRLDRYVGKGKPS